VDLPEKRKRGKNSAALVDLKKKGGGPASTVQAERKAMQHTGKDSRLWFLLPKDRQP